MKQTKNPQRCGFFVVGGGSRGDSNPDSISNALELGFRQRQERPERNLLRCRLRGCVFEQAEQGVEARFVGIAQVLRAVEQQGVSGRRQPRQVAQAVAQRVPVAATAVGNGECLRHARQYGGLVGAIAQVDPARQQSGIVHRLVQGRDVIRGDEEHAREQRIAQIEGVGQVEITGSSLPAVRVQLNAGQMDKLGIGAEQVRTTIVENNVLRPKGAIGAGEQRWQIGANDQARAAIDYAPLVVAFRNGAPVRLTDIATVVDSVEDVRNVGFADGRPAVLLLVRKQIMGGQLAEGFQIR